MQRSNPSAKRREKREERREERGERREKRERTTWQQSVTSEAFWNSPTTANLKDLTQFLVA